MNNCNYILVAVLKVCESADCSHYNKLSRHFCAASFSTFRNRDVFLMKLSCNIIDINKIREQCLSGLLSCGSFDQSYRNFRDAMYDASNEKFTEQWFMIFGVPAKADVTFPQTRNDKPYWLTVHTTVTFRSFFFFICILFSPYFLPFFSSMKFRWIQYFNLYYTLTLKVKNSRMYLEPLFSLIFFKQFQFRDQKNISRNKNVIRNFLKKKQDEMNEW